jgi:hypothetical protein
MIGPGRAERFFRSSSLPLPLLIADGRPSASPAAAVVWHVSC